jgi:hypothetical protein
MLRIFHTDRCFQQGNSDNLTIRTKFSGISGEENCMCLVLIVLQNIQYIGYILKYETLLVSDCRTFLTCLACMAYSHANGEGSRASRNFFERCPLAPSKMTGWCQYYARRLGRSCSRIQYFPKGVNEGFEMLQKYPRTSAIASDLAGSGMHVSKTPRKSSHFQ